MDCLEHIHNYLLRPDHSATNREYSMANDQYFIEFCMNFSICQIKMFRRIQRKAVVEVLFLFTSSNSENVEQ